MEDLFQNPISFFIIYKKSKFFNSLIIPLQLKSDTDYENCLQFSEDYNESEVYPEYFIKKLELLGDSLKSRKLLIKYCRNVKIWLS